MSDYDRANIHEVMEQQTVSISKAGITTRLNARASVLAAANPIYGRYNKKLTPQQNINLPAALLSRFDLIFLVLDKVDSKIDEMLAKHVTYVHQYNTAPKDNSDTLSPQFIRSYLSEAKKIDPVVPKELHNFIVEKYVNIRTNDFKNIESVQYITPRTLLAIIRIAQGLARLRFNTEVEQIDIDNAIKLVDASRYSLKDEEENHEKKVIKNDVISNIFQLIRDLCSKKPDKTVKLSEIERRLVNQGFTSKSLKDCVNEYSKLNVLMVSDDESRITLL
jgi:DNA replication licensing factor MCM7